MLRTVTIALSTLTLVPGLAAADDAELHDFATMDRATGHTSAGADLSFVTGDLGSADGFVSRLDLHGEYVLPSGLGFYGQLATARAFLDSSDPLTGALTDMADSTTLSNLELGALYRRQLAPDLSIVAHAGVSLPTASDDFGGLLTNLLASQRRMGDLVNAIPQTTALRFGVSPSWQHGVVFARADLGADIVIDEPEMQSSDPVVHANLAVGARQGKLSGALELVNIGTTGDVEQDGDRFLHTAALSVQYAAGRVAPSLTVVTPLDDDGRGDVITIGAGVAARF